MWESFWEKIEKVKRHQELKKKKSEQRANNNKNKPATFHHRKGENVAPCKISLSLKAEEREEKPHNTSVEVIKAERALLHP